MEPYLRITQALESLAPGERNEFLDCVLQRTGDWYELGFTDAEGCRPLWPYAPKTRYMVSKGCWHVRQGSMEFLVSQSPILELLFELRGYLLTGPPSRSALCLDIGPGSSGLFGLYCAAQGAGRVVFAEADSRALQLVRANIALNKFTRTECIQAALCGQNGKIAFRQDADIDASSLVRSTHKVLSEEPVVEVQALRLAELFARLQPDHQQSVLCKLDIEGAEVELVADFADLIARYPKCVFAVASYHPTGDGESAAVLEQGLEGAEDVCCKTLFKAHRTTFIHHRNNAAVRAILSKY